MLLADSIAENGRVDLGEVGIMPHHHISDQYLRFRRLAEGASVDELLFLTDHVNPTLRYYSLLGLISKEDKRILQTYVTHLDDTGYVRTLLFDMVENGRIGWFLKENMLPQHLISAPLGTLDYGIIKRLAQDSTFPAAWVSLARFKKEQDEELLQRLIFNSLFVWEERKYGPNYLYYSPMCIREYPTPRFYPLVKKIIQEKYAPRNRVMMQALMQYRNEETADIVMSILKKSKGDDKWNVQVSVAVALIRYPDSIFGAFHSIKKELSLDFGSYEMATEWAKDEL